MDTEIPTAGFNRRLEPPMGLEPTPYALRMSEQADVSGAFGYRDSILFGARVRLRGMRDDDVPTLAKWEMDPGAWPGL
jgi:hypothetical protein